MYVNMLVGSLTMLLFVDLTGKVVNLVLGWVCFSFFCLFLVEYDCRNLLARTWLTYSWKSERWPFGKLRMRNAKCKCLCPESLALMKSQRRCKIECWKRLCEDINQWTSSQMKLVESSFAVAHWHCAIYYIQ